MNSYRYSIPYYCTARTLKFNFQRLSLPINQQFVLFQRV